MERLTVRDVRRAFPSAESLQDDELQELIDACTAVRLLDNSVLFDADDPSDAFFLVVSGRVRVERMLSDGERVPLGLLSRGHIVGDMGVLTGRPRSASAVVDVEVHALRLHAQTYQQMQEEGHPGVLWVLGVINVRMSERIADMYRRVAHSDAQPELIEQLPAVEPAPTSVIERAVGWVKERVWN